MFLGFDDLLGSPVGELSNENPLETRWGRERRRICRHIGQFFFPGV